MVGEKALHTENNSGKTRDIISPIVKGVDITEDHAYLLYVFITNVQPLKRVYAHLAKKKTWLPTLGYLNPFLGIFQVTGQNVFEIFFIVYLLCPRGGIISKSGLEFKKEITITTGYSLIS